MTIHSLSFSAGDLVKSPLFSGIAKIVQFVSPETVEIAWFYSPLQAEMYRQTVAISALALAELYEECTVYFRSPTSGLWCRANYGGAKPDNKHWLVLSSGEKVEVELCDIFYPNYGKHQAMDPAHFLATRANDAHDFYPLREKFVNAWIKQRAACRSMSSLISSRVDIEPHQIAVVCRILQDENPKYLLADEVGLGKTIQAGLVIREHVLELKQNARVLILVPQALLSQWRNELITRFDLADVMEGGRSCQILLRTHEQLDDVVPEKWPPTLIAVDEAHQLASLAWGQQHKSRFEKMARLCHLSRVALLLSGTPMNGNERNFLAMLHCLNPEGWTLDEAGVTQFLRRAEERAHLGGIYSSLLPDTPNAVIERSLEELSEQFGDDESLMTHVDGLRPLVDFFAEEAGDERTQRIVALRDWIGENYRLYHRLLRNRRDNPALSWLFPGLDGIQMAHWDVAQNEVSLDELIEEYRSCASVYPHMYPNFTAQNGLAWLDAHFTSPLILTRLAKQVLDNGAGSDEERALLEQIISTAKLEQKRKDDLLIEQLKRWFTAHPQGKAVVFCAEESAAARVFVKLGMAVQQRVIRHQPEQPDNALALASNWQIMVCDKRGEDGLNLHGEQRLAVHYALSRDFNRFEQRLGRFNRYSSTLNSSKVQSLVLLPSRASLMQAWMTLLDEGIGLFNNSVASLQFVLETKLEETWQRFLSDGVKALDAATNDFRGESGLIALERQRENAQENLLSMEQEVIAAREFAEQLLHAEHEAQEQAIDLLRWITDALKFVQYSDEKNGFRLRFERGNRREKTRVDIPTFLNTCLLGMDYSKGYPPTSAAMSLERDEVSASDSHIFPFRYGQPFIEAVWELMQQDPRGTTMAFLRMEKNSARKRYSPALYCHFSWLVTADAEGDFTASGQRRRDAKFAPRMVNFWLDDLNEVAGDDICETLEKPYDSTGNSAWEDYSLHADRWAVIEQWFPAPNWQGTLLKMAQEAQAIAQERVENVDGVVLHYQLMAMKAVILCTRETILGEQ